MGDCKERCFSSVTDTVNCLFSSCIPTVEREEAPSSYTGLHDTAYRKEELKQLVGIFASRAQRYLACTRVDIAKGEFKKARYKLDCRLRTLRVESDEAPVEISLSKVKAVYGYEDLQLLDSYESFLNQEIIQNLGSEERDRLSVIVYTTERGADAQLVLMEHEIETSDAFITVLRILQMHAQGKQ